jgi:transcription antitermination factor NusG
MTGEILYPEFLYPGGEPASVTDTAWFALAVSPRKEKSVARVLRLRGYQDFLPVNVIRRRWSDRMQDVEVPLFPGYVFCRLDPARRLPVLQLPAVHSILGKQGVPDPVPEAEIQALRVACNCGLEPVPCPYVAVGAKVRITEGPLNGIEGILVETKPTRLVLSISLLQRSISIEIERSWIVPMKVYREFQS